MKFIEVPDCAFKMGTDDGIGFDEDLEYPSTEVKISKFEIAQTPVTNEEFFEFIEDTNYKTKAEKEGFSFVYSLLVPEEKRNQYKHVIGAPWWLVVPGASWKHPFGPESDLSGIKDHPVVHISLADALAFCKWGKYTLPSEAQWECACRAGTETTYPWGMNLVDDKFHANTWQGKFPWENTEEDGFLGTAPVKTYEPNNWGLYQMIGNVWEWCRNPRYVSLSEFKTKKFILDHAPANGEYAIRGGSFLCHCLYCNRYRSAARNGADVNTTSSNLGFRCIKELN